MKKVIIFDLDGVLFDTTELAKVETKKIHPSITDEMIKEIHSKNFIEMIDKLKPLRILETEEEKTIRKKAYSEKKLGAPMYEGMFEVLENLVQHNYILALNTSASNNNCLPLLKKVGIQSFFKFIGTREVSRSKAEKFKIIKERFNTSYEEMVFVTDTIGDVLEAQEAGVPTIAVTWGVHTCIDFESKDFSNLYSIVESPESLRQLLLT